MSVAQKAHLFRKPTDAYNLHPFNAMKLLAHRDRVEAMLAGEVVFPISVELDLSLKCNHGCEWCSFDGWRQANWINFPIDRALTLIDELRACGVKSITLTGGGEPLIHPGIVEIIQRIVSNRMEFGVVTNGWMLVGFTAELIAKHATFVRVSLDAGEPETHRTIHKTKNLEFLQILNNIADVVAIAKGCDRERPLTVGASFCVFDINVDEIMACADHLESRGANYLEVRPIYPTTWRGGRQDTAGLSQENVDRAKTTLELAKSVFNIGSTFRVIGIIDRFDAVKAFSHLDFYSECRITNLSTVISADGHIYACCVHRGLPEFSGGSVLERPFAEVWTDSQRRKVSDTINVAKCPKCRYVGLNSVIESALVNGEMHHNFI